MAPSKATLVKEKDNSVLKWGKKKGRKAGSEGGRKKARKRRSEGGREKQTTIPIVCFFQNVIWLESDSMQPS